MENLRLDDFKKYKYLSNMNFSPDGKNCGFILHQMDIDKNTYLSYIYILNWRNEIVKITSTGEESSLLWQDNKTILFPATRDKEPFTSFYKIDIDERKAEKTFEIPMDVKNIKKIDDDNYLLVALENFKEENDYEILDEIPFWSNGRGFTNKKRNMLCIYNIKSRNITRISGSYSNVEHFELSKDKKHIAFITSSFKDKMTQYRNLNIYSIDENSSSIISPFHDFNYSYCNFIDDDIVFMGSNMKSYGLNENPQVYITDFSGSSIRKISDSDSSLSNSLNADSTYGDTKEAKVYDNFLYYITTEGGNSLLYRTDTKGNTERLTVANGSINDFDVSDGKIYFIGMRGLCLQEIYELKTDEIKITEFNTWVNEEKKLSYPEKITLPLDNKMNLEGWIVKPVDYEEDKSYPAILNIHGGPKTAYGGIFFHEMQYWANEGYFVFYCNPRGSDGYGDEYADIRGKYGTVDFDDLMDFTDLVLDRYQSIDKNRLGVTGGSYGGFMVNWIISHSSRFKAAVSERCISNWFSFFGISDIGYFFAKDQTGTTPWDDSEKMWNNSPIKYADRVTTPTLFIHSRKDYRCPIPEGLQMFTALKYHGVESRFLAFNEENHGLSRSGKPRSRIKRLEEIITWFNKYLK